MYSLDELLKKLEDQRFGILAESNTYQLTVVAGNADVAVGDLFLLPSRRGKQRVYVFRTTQYANILNRSLEMSDIARNKLTMPDSYFSQDLASEQLLELKGMVLGYAQAEDDGWRFYRPRRLPEHLCDVYHVEASNPEVGDVMRALMSSQLGQEGLYVGNLLAGEESLESVKVYLPTYALSHHIGVFGKTGAGKSNLMMVLLKSVLDFNRQEKNRDRPKGSILAIDPHDEFRYWHYYQEGGADGIHGIMESYSDEERRNLVEPFYYLTAKNLTEDGLERQVKLSRADLTPSDLISITEFSEQQIAFVNQQFALWGEMWIMRVLMGDTEGENNGFEGGAEFLPGTISAVQRRLDFLRRGQSRLITAFDPEMEDEDENENEYKYDSLLPDIICALEQGRVLVVDTTLMSEMEQFLLTTVVARTLFTLRKALKSVERSEELEEAIRISLGDDGERTGSRQLAEELIARLEDGRLLYRDGETLTTLDQLPFVNVVIEEAPSVLNPQRMRFGSVFRDISRQGRKFGIGLTVVSQQVSEIDTGVLTQINTELIMSLGNEMERKEAIRNASADMMGFERELQVMGKGQTIVSASYKDVPLPVQVPEFDTLINEI